MKIAYVIIDANRTDGTARALVEVAERLARDHEVHLFSHTLNDVDTTRVTWHRVRAWPWPEMPKFTSFLVRCSLRMMGSGAKFDIIHSAGCNTAGAHVYTVQNVQPAKYRILRKAGAFRSGGIARTIHRWLYFKTTGQAERMLYRPCRVDGIDRHFLPVSRGIAKELTEWLSLPAERMTIIPNGADLDRFSPVHREASRAEIRPRYGLQPDDFVLLFVGGEWKRKGLNHAVDALRFLPDPRIKLLIVGRDAAQPEYEERVRALGLAGRVIFGGFAGDIHRVYAASDAFVFPTYYEAFSLASIEAAASGLPVLAASTNGTEELIRPGENGWLIPHDGAAIAKHVEQLSTDAGLLNRMGRRAREIAEAEYSWDRIAERTADVYRMLLEERRKRRAGSEAAAP